MNPFSFEIYHTIEADAHTRFHFSPWRDKS